MGGSGSSSKRKPSKKRNQKPSPQKKKNKGKELKQRHRRRHDSVSSFSHDDSVNSDCSSSSKSISDYRRKMKKSKRRDYSVTSYSDDDHSRSRNRKSKKLRRTKTASKSSNKMAARKRYRSSSPESYGDVRKTKRKRSTGDSESKRKKKSSTKKSKRHLSPDSLSCSTCPSKSSSSISTVDGKKSERSKQIVNMETTAIMRDEVTSPRPSYLPPVNKSSRRLRSVINVAYQPPEEDRWNGNPREEEIGHELENYYPTPISLDCNNEVGGKRRELDNHSHGIISNKRIKLEHVTTAEEKNELGKSGLIHVSPSRTNNNFEEKETTNVSVVPAAALDGDGNMESILRQKALENLKKFKAARLQTAPQSSITNVKTNNENDDVPNKSVKQASPNTQLTNQRSGPTFGKDSSHSEVKKHPEPEGERIEEAVKQNIIITVSTSDINPGTPVTHSSITEPTSSSARPISGKEERDGVKDGGPEFEQKTMSVMRGGEMVQVTYKVKIPKRAPALARRQLRR